MATRRRIHTSDDFGGIALDVTEAGPAGGPVIVLSHGFPESSHSWRHQIEPLAAAGWRVLVPDQRGYARSSAPEEVEAYRSDRLSADLLALLDDVGADDAVFVGHDWGALLVWDLARYHPDRVRAAINVSVPYTRWPMRPTELFAEMWGDRFFYMTYFQTVGPPEAELEADIERTMRLTLWGGSGEMSAPPPDPSELPPAAGTGFLSGFEERRQVPDGVPGWLTSDDLATYVEQFTASGFFGPISWYRNLDADWELTHELPAPPMPTAFIGGELDLVIAHRPEYVESQRELLPDFRGIWTIPGAGHWTQQERPAEFNAALHDALAATT
ncbi:MAG: alpha/beta hydrolase [Actinomycetota bacterium]